MNAPFRIIRATVDDAQDVAILVGELLSEIMDVVGDLAFRFEPDETILRLKNAVDCEQYVVFVARNRERNAVGFISLCESFALYTEGAFGIIPELYVRPQYRSKQLGRNLLSHAKSFSLSRGWKRLEVTTPPLPQFDQTLAFYAREGFDVSGGRKMKLLL